ncbi:transposase, partial [Prevotella sp.]|uniref:transposase n=1 Tax=Prevotella sp. TaxID=59823 RepID=UPI0025DE447E
IEPEAVFGQIKYNMAYRRFRHIGVDKVKMDFAFFAIAFNIKKMVAKKTKGGLFSYLRAYLTHITPYKLFIRLFFVEKQKLVVHPHKNVQRVFLFILGVLTRPPEQSGVICLLRLRRGRHSLLLFALQKNQYVMPATFI